MAGSATAVPHVVEIVRQRAFEASHRYWVPEWSEEENRRRFGPCTSLFGHGHNYVAEVTVRGPVDVRTGMVVNVVEIDRALAAVVSRLDHRFVNVEIPGFGPTDPLPCVEVLARYVRRKVSEAMRASGIAPSIGVVAARVAEDETLAGVCRLVEITSEPAEMHASKEQTMRDATVCEVVNLVRSYTFSAAHRLHASALTPEENRTVFGKCNNPHGHGHNYQLDVTIVGVPDARTGMVVDLAQLDAVVEEHVLARVDHRHLNCEVPPFDVVNPTSENVARVIWEWLVPVCPGTLAEITLHETPRSRFTFRKAER